MTDTFKTIGDKWNAMPRPHRLLLVRGGVILLILIIGFVVYVSKPFQKEARQIEDLRSLTKTEKNAETLSQQMGGFLKREQSLKEVIPGATSSPVVQTSPAVYTSFALQNVTEEAEKAEHTALEARIREEQAISGVQNDIAYFLSALYETR